MYTQLYFYFCSTYKPVFGLHYFHDTYLFFCNKHTFIYYIPSYLEIFETFIFIHFSLILLNKKVRSLCKESRKARKILLQLKRKVDYITIFMERCQGDDDDACKGPRLV